MPEYLRRSKGAAAAGVVVGVARRPVAVGDQV
jgi:hypothetical protein